MKKQTDKGWLGWTAGIIDGEGCIYITRYRSGNQQRPTYALYVSVGNTDRPMLEKLCALWGSNVMLRRKQSTQLTATPRIFWLWAIQGKMALKMLNACRLYMIAKRDQCEVALDFLSTFGNGGRRTPTDAELELREQCYVRLRELKT